MSQKIELSHHVSKLEIYSVTKVGLGKLKIILLFQSFTFHFSIKTASHARCIMREHLKPHIKGILPVEAQQHVRVLAFDHF